MITNLFGLDPDLGSCLWSHRLPRPARVKDNGYSPPTVIWVGQIGDPTERRVKIQASFFSGRLRGFIMECLISKIVSPLSPAQGLEHLRKLR